MKTNQEHNEESQPPSDIILGKGSFATVYLGKDQHGKQIAIKSVDKKKLNKQLKQSLWNEIQMMKDIQHPHIITLLSVQETHSHILLNMEFCELGDLSKFIQNHKNQNQLNGIHPVYIHAFLHQLSSALQSLRHLNLIHRDLKPHNILLTHPTFQQIQQYSSLKQQNSNQLIGIDLNTIPMMKLADFGFARILKHQDLAETLCGSPLYMAPEILRYEKYDAKADLWSVGTILYEMMTGKTPFRAHNPMELLKKIQKAASIVFPDDHLPPKQSKETEEEKATVTSPICIPKSEEQPVYFSTPPSVSLSYSPSFSTSFNSTKSFEVNSGLPKVAPELKQLVRDLLRKNPVERVSFEEFFLRDCVRMGVHFLFQHPTIDTTPVMSEEKERVYKKMSQSLISEGQYSVQQKQYHSLSPSPHPISILLSPIRPFSTHSNSHTISQSNRRKSGLSKTYQKYDDDDELLATTAETGNTNSRAESGTSTPVFDMELDSGSVSVKPLLMMTHFSEWPNLKPEKPSTTPFKNHEEQRYMQIHDALSHSLSLKPTTTPLNSHNMGTKTSHNTTTKEISHNTNTEGWLEYMTNLGYQLAKRMYLQSMIIEEEEEEEQTGIGEEERDGYMVVNVNKL